MNKKILKYIRIVVTIAIPCLFVWFLIIGPYLEFKNNEKIMREAAERYYQLNEDKLPTGKRIATVSLKTLFDKSFIKNDFYLPYSKKPCSVTESWVKVRQRESGSYDYYTYLQCGPLKSNVDHTGPKIILNGDSEITLNLGNEYKEPGIKSVKDNVDGKMSNDSVTIDSSKVDTSKIGTYEVTYSAQDNMKNKTTVIRKVNVVQKLNTTIKQEIGENGIYKGYAVNNYFRFSGMLFRIVGLDGDNIKIVTANDVANVNYDGIDEWLDYFYEHIADSSKKYLVKNKYCYGDIASNSIHGNTECPNKTKDKYVYILSNKEINESRDEAGKTYLLSSTITWTANASDKETAWAVKDLFINGTQTMGFQREYNFGIRPVLTIKGDSLIVSGDGSVKNPYSLGELPKAKADEFLNTRYSGEYLTYSGYTWRIIESDTDGTTKVIAETPINLATDKQTIMYETDGEVQIYNPTEKGNIGYTINKKVGDTVNEKYFVTKEVTVPIYKTVAKYKEEIKSKKYKVKFAAPNMYEMHTASKGEVSWGYWLINSSEQEYRKYFISNIGIVVYVQTPTSFEQYVRPVGYLDKKVKIVSGSGTELDPYKISK